MSSFSAVPLFLTKRIVLHLYKVNAPYVVTTSVRDLLPRPNRLWDSHEIQLANSPHKVLMQRLRENSISDTDSWLNDAYNFRTRSTAQDIHHFVTNIRLIMVILILYIDQITFIPPSHKHHSFNVHFNIILKLFTRNSAALYAVSNISGTYCYCASLHISIYISNYRQLTVIFSRTHQRNSSVH